MTFTTRRLRSQIPPHRGPTLINLLKTVQQATTHCHRSAICRISTLLGASRNMQILRMDYSAMMVEVPLRQAVSQTNFCKTLRKICLYRNHQPQANLTHQAASNQAISLPHLLRIVRQLRTNVPSIAYRVLGKKSKHQSALHQVLWCFQDLQALRLHLQ